MGKIYAAGCFMGKTYAERMLVPGYLYTRIPGLWILHASRFLVGYFVIYDDTGLLDGVVWSIVGVF